MNEIPNWCSQDLSITGSVEDIKKFKEFAKSDENCLDTNKFIPMPEPLLEVSAGSDDDIYKIWYGDIDGDREKLKVEEGKRNPKSDEIAKKQKHNMDNYGHINWYSWAYENWGTKWGICNPELEDAGGMLFYHFESAWSPVLPVILKMSQMFPKLKFELEYYEMGVGFQGEFHCENGQVTRSEEAEYHGDRGG